MPQGGRMQCIQWGKWERPYESLPDAVKWPAFAPIRENMLEALQWLEIIWSKTMDESFIDLELFYVPRPNLARLDIRGTYLIKKFTLSPYDKLPALTYLDISCMAVLENVLIQCNSLEWVTLARSFELKKALLETRNLKELIIDTCPKLGTLIIWSEELTSIKGLTDSKILTKLELFCPKLVDFERPPLYVIEKPKVYHPMILQLLKWEAAGEPEPPKEFGLLKKDLEVQDQLGWDSRAGTYPNHPLLPRTFLVGF
ncbi:unnamed protein product [Sphagnum jensenii]|uniref:Uncharacterized protein n=1 Tax=Sphagnum jensenii TaxID=128206 RepID=A0ABP0WIH0_9BRYO